ncbi:hypothetical protein K380107A5_16910 [Holdemania massiliensis]
MEKEQLFINEEVVAIHTIFVQYAHIVMDENELARSILLRTKRSEDTESSEIFRKGKLSLEKGD